MLRTAFVLAAMLGLGVARPTAQMDSNVQLLGIKLVDAEYSRSLDRIVIVSDSPSNRLVILDPATGTGRGVPLPAYPQCVSVAPDGLHAAVGHEIGTISYIDLQTATVVKTLSVTTYLYDLVLAGNGFMYAFPQIEPVTQVHCIEIATDLETMSTGNWLFGGNRARLHPDGEAIYCVQTAGIPGALERDGITNGTAEPLYNWPYSLEYDPCGNLWLAQDGQRIFTRCGEVFSTSDVQSQDMLHVGTLSQLDAIQSLWDSQATGKIFVIPQKHDFNDPESDGRLQLYDDASLGFADAVDLPLLLLDHLQYATHGWFVCADDAGTRVSMLVKVDAGLALDGGLVTYALRAAPLSTSPSELSLGTGGQQLLHLDAGESLAGKPYLVLGSAHGTSPGVVLGTVTVPLNFDKYFALTARQPNGSYLVNAAGLLDQAGQAEAAFQLPAGAPPALLGLTLNHAFVVIDGAAVFASNPEPLSFTP